MQLQEESRPIHDYLERHSEIATYSHGKISWFYANWPTQPQRQRLWNGSWSIAPDQSWEIFANECWSEEMINQGLSHKSSSKKHKVFCYLFFFLPNNRSDLVHVGDLQPLNEDWKQSFNRLIAGVQPIRLCSEMNSSFFGLWLKNVNHECELVHFNLNQLSFVWPYTSQTVSNMWLYLWAPHL